MAMKFQSKSFAQRRAERIKESLERYPEGVESRRTITERTAGELEKLETEAKKKDADMSLLSESELRAYERKTQQSLMREPLTTVVKEKREESRTPAAAKAMQEQLTRQQIQTPLSESEIRDYEKKTQQIQASQPQMQTPISEKELIKYYTTTPSGLKEVGSAAWEFGKTQIKGAGKLFFEFTPTGRVIRKFPEVEKKAQELGYISSSKGVGVFKDPEVQSALTTTAFIGGFAAGSAVAPLITNIGFSGLTGYAGYKAYKEPTAESIAGVGLIAGGLLLGATVPRTKAAVVKPKVGITISFIKEAPIERIIKTPYGKIKATFDESGNIKSYDVISKTEVKIKNLFGKEKIYYPKTVGKVETMPTNIENVYAVKGRYITKLNKEQILSRVKSFAKKGDKEVDAIVGKGVTYKGKSINKLTKEELLDYLSGKGAIKAKAEPYSFGGINKGIKTPLDQFEASLSKIRVQEKKAPSYLEKGINLFLKPIRETGTKFFEIIRGARAAEIKSTTTNLADLIAQTTKKAVKEAAVKAVRQEIAKESASSFRIIPSVAAAEVTTAKQQVKPSIYEGTGMYERTTEVMPVIPKQKTFLEVIPIEQELTKLKKENLLLPQEKGTMAEKQEQKNMLALKPIIEELSLTKEQTKQMQKQKYEQLQIRKQLERQLQKQIQEQRQQLRETTQQITKPRLAPKPTFLPTRTPPPPQSQVFSRSLAQKLRARLQLFDVLIKRQGKYFEIKTGVTKEKAIKLGEKLARFTLAASFKLKPTGKFISGIEKEYKPSPEVFRAYKILKGKKIPLELEWIQKSKYRLSSFGEVKEIQKAKKSAFFASKKSRSRGVNWF